MLLLFFFWLLLILRMLLLLSMFKFSLFLVNKFTLWRLLFSFSGLVGWVGVVLAGVGLVGWYANQHLCQINLMLNCHWVEMLTKQAGSCIGCEAFLEVKIGQLRPRYIIQFPIWIITFPVLKINFKFLGINEKHFVKEVFWLEDWKWDK